MKKYNKQTKNQHAYFNPPTTVTPTAFHNHALQTDRQNQTTDKQFPTAYLAPELFEAARGGESHTRAVHFDGKRETRSRDEDETPSCSVVQVRVWCLPLLYLAANPRGRLTALMRGPIHVQAVCGHVGGCLVTPPTADQATPIR